MRKRNKKVRAEKSNGVSWTFFAVAFILLCGSFGMLYVLLAHQCTQLTKLNDKAQQQEQQLVSDCQREEGLWAALLTHDNLKVQLQRFGMEMQLHDSSSLIAMDSATLMPRQGRYAITRLKQLKRIGKVVQR